MKIERMHTKGKVDNYLALAFSVKDPNSVFGAASDGKLAYLKNRTVIEEVVIDKHAVQSVLCKENAAGSEHVFVSSTSKDLKIFEFKSGSLSKKPIMEFKLSAPARAMDLYKDQLCLGMKNGHIEVLEYQKEGAKPRIVMNTHCDGEVWGLATVTLEDGSSRIVTSADDNKILAYNPVTRKCIGEGTVYHGKKIKKKMKHSASSMSKQPPYK